MNDVKVYLLNIESVRRNKDRILPLLSFEQKERAKAKKTEENYLQSLASSYLIQKHTDPTKPLVYSPYGKPTKEGSFFSISHSSSLVSLLVSDVPCGVDIEKIRSFNNKLIPRFFSKDEQSSIQEAKDFFLVWTRKEALAKCEGSGLNLENLCQIPSHDGRNEYKNSIYCTHSVIYEDYVLSVSLSEKDFDTIEIINE